MILTGKVSIYLPFLDQPMKPTGSNTHTYIAVS